MYRKFINLKIGKSILCGASTSAYVYVRNKYIKTKYDNDVVKYINPDYVFEFRVERFLF